MKKFIFLVLTLILNINCKDKIEKKNVDKKEVITDFNTSINRRKPFEKIYLKEKQFWNKIVISKVDTTLEYSYFHKSKINRYSPVDINNVYEFSNDEQIKLFDKLIKESEKTGYFGGCPKNHSIKLYKNSKFYKSYDIGSLFEDKKFVLISEGPYYSYKISIEKLNQFLKEGNSLNHKEFYIKDLNKARKIYKAAKKYNLPILNSYYLPEYWAKYDGSFNVDITIYKETEVEYIEKEINNKYNDEKFYVDIYNAQQEVESYLNNDNIKSTIHLTIYSDFNFYKNFEIFETKKSKFQIAKGYFCVLGSEKKLKYFEEVLKKKTN